MIVVCLEGCHGSGKTELLRRFEAAGYMVLDEGFLDMPDYAIHPQTLLMETTWVCQWFLRLLKKAEEMKNVDGEQVFITDRSPFSAVFYAADGHLLDAIIRKHMEEVKRASNIEVITVHVRVEKELLWGRIQKRLEAEPSRARYNEHKRSWMEDVLGFYNSFGWDVTVENNEDPIEKVKEELVHVVCDRSHRFKRSLTYNHHLAAHVEAALRRHARALSRARARSESRSASSGRASPRSSRAPTRDCSPHARGSRPQTPSGAAHEDADGPRAPGTGGSSACSSVTVPGVCTSIARRSRHSASFGPLTDEESSAVHAATLSGGGASTGDEVSGDDYASADDDALSLDGLQCAVTAPAVDVRALGTAFSTAA